MGPRLSSHLKLLLTLTPVLCVVAPSAAQQTFHTTEDLRIRGDFVFLSQLVVDSAGQIAVFEWNDKEFHLFSADGKVHRRFGRVGSGPGEFNGSARLGVAPNGFWIADYMNARVTLLSRAFTLLGSHRSPTALSGAASGPSLGAGMPSVVGAGRGETLLLQSSPLATGARGLEARVIGFGGATVTLASQQGQIARVVARVPAAPQCAAVDFEKHSAATLRLCARPFLSVSSDGSRVVTLEPIAGAAPAYRVTMISTSGDTIFSGTQRYARVRIPRTVADTSFTDALKVEPKVKVPEYFPPAERLLLGRDETVWIEESDEFPGHTWRILDRKGALAGRLTLPKGKLMEADLGHLWVIERDDDDVPSIVRYRLTGPGAGRR